MRQCEEQKPMPWAGLDVSCDGLSVSRKMKVTLLSPASTRLAQILHDKHQRQLATRNSSSNRINIGTPGNNLLMGIEALKIIQWLVSKSHPKFSSKSSSWHNQEGVKVSIFPVNIETIIPGFASCWQFCAFPLIAPELLLHVYSGACMLCHVQLLVTPWTVAPQAPLRMGFPRQEY